MRAFDMHQGCRLHDDAADPECFGCLIRSVVDDEWLAALDRLVSERFPERSLPR